MHPPKMRFLPIFILMVLAISGEALGLEAFQADPDQVLVLYNEDWEKDVDWSLPGQDSKEVAEYYVDRHTDPVSGKKPHLLGLSCVHHRKHLNHWVIDEKSQDNRNGVVFQGKGLPPGKNEWARDSRHVKIVVEDKAGNINWDSVKVWCSSLLSKTKKEVSPIVSGIPVAKGRRWTYPEIGDKNGRCFRFDAHAIFPGTVSVYFEVKDNQGRKVRDLKLKYYDRDDFIFSMVGPDRVADDENFQEDVAIPVKRFLEDRENCLPDGTLLKDHILYIVVCHGLPFSCEGVWGIERGVTANPSDHGDRASLEQRLQTLYYGWGSRLTPPVISMYMSGGPDAKSGVCNYRITSALRYPLYGKRWNVYMHPDTYNYLGSRNNGINHDDIPPFSEIRKKTPAYFFGYGVSRIDGPGPREAKRMVDYALYASQYLRPEMLAAVRKDHTSSLKTNAKLDQKLDNVIQEKLLGSAELNRLGFEKLPGQNERGVPFLKIPLDESMNRFRYLPGGMDRVVDSANGWNNHRDSPIWKETEQGVTISACGGPAYGGGPHITNATFWDNRVLMRYLFRGRDLGECFLLSTLYINWSTSLIGDPLYHPDLGKTQIDKIPPTPAIKEAIQIKLFPTMGKVSALIKVPIRFSKDVPEVALLDAYFRKQGEQVEKCAFSLIFSSQPMVIVRDLEPGSRYRFRLVLTDPYGNQSDLSEQFGVFQVDVENQEKDGPEWMPISKKGDGWSFKPRRLEKLIEKGTIKVRFKAGEHGLMPSVDAGGLHFKAEKYWPEGRSQFFFKVGGVERRAAFPSPLDKGETATILVRWRRQPLTREVLLLADDSTEFPLLADVRTPWEKMYLSERLKLIEIEGVSILSALIIDDAEPASTKAMGIEVKPIKKEEWDKACGG